MLKKVLVAVAVLALLVVGVLGFATTRPDDFRVERSARISAPPEVVYPLIDDFHRWAEWSPWEGLDPEMRTSHTGPVRGVGASYAWEGNRKVGRGRMEILEATPPSLVKIDLQFMEPFEARNAADFTLRGEGGETQMTWAIYGPNTFAGKVMSVFVSMDRMMGGDLERGFENLKAASEEG